MTDVRFDLWNSTTRKKIAFDASPELALHWLGKLVVEHGREFVREHVKMIWWPPQEIGIKFSGGDLLDFLDVAQLYGVPADDVVTA